MEKEAPNLFREWKIGKEMIEIVPRSSTHSNLSRDRLSSAAPNAIILNITFVTKAAQN